MAFKHDPFALVDHSHAAKKERSIRRKHSSRGMVHHMKYRSLYDTKYSPAAKDKVPSPRG